MLFVNPFFVFSFLFLLFLAFLLELYSIISVFLQKYARTVDVYPYGHRFISK